MTHKWTHHPATGFTYCAACGIVKRSDGSNKLCPGPTPAVEGLWGAPR